VDYKTAGVDIEAGRSFVENIRTFVAATRRPEVLGNLGGFGGCFALPSGYSEPVLVSGTDGVGTKLKIAQSLDRHDTIGIDLVAMCANDVLTNGAEPLFFLDYLATGKLEGDRLAQVVKGISDGCQEAGCALLGGETAEMPGFYAPGEYDVAGFCVGIVEKSKILDGSQVRVGDRVIGLPSSGVHSNGFSLVRKIVDDRGLNWNDKAPFSYSSLGDVFLTPTRLYVKPILSALREGLDIRGMAHITGGGLPENLPRCLGEGQAIAIDRAAWQVRDLFRWIAAEGNVTDTDMFETFNMGMGYAIVVPKTERDRAITYLEKQHLAARDIGEVVAGEGNLIWS